MSLQEVKAKVTKGDRAGVDYVAKVNLPDSIQEAVEQWGEEIVHNRFMASIIIDVQATMRHAINKDGATPETIAAAAESWSPQVRVKGMSPQERIQTLLAKLSPEEREAVLAEFA